MTKAEDLLNTFIQRADTHNTEVICNHMMELCKAVDLDVDQDFRQKCSNFDMFSRVNYIKTWTREQFVAWWRDGEWLPWKATAPAPTYEVPAIDGLIECYGIEYELEVLKLRGFDGDEETLVQTDMEHPPPMYPRDTCLTIETDERTLSYRVRDTLVLIKKDADGVVTKISHQVRVII